MEFLDTNVLVYAVSHRTADRAKQVIARQLIRFDGQAISLQVLQEFYVVCRAPRKLGLSHEEAVSYSQPWRRFLVLEPSMDQYDAALRLCAAHSLSFYDAAILAAAAQLECDTLYSEDLAHGQIYGGVRVMNPFLKIPTEP